MGSSSLEGKACTWINGLKEAAGFRVSSILAVEGSEEFEGRFGGWVWARAWSGLSLLSCTRQSWLSAHVN